jgi:hypothetical protein
MTTPVISALAVLGMASALFATDNPTICAARSDLAGPCYQVHGRLRLTNGSPGVRLWVIGTKRVLGVGTLEDDENNIMPVKVSSQFLNTATQIYADFLVCPFEKDIPGKMRMICIESAKNMIVYNLDDQGNESYKRVPNE